MRRFAAVFASYIALTSGGSMLTACSEGGGAGTHFDASSTEPGLDAGGPGILDAGPPRDAYRSDAHRVPHDAGMDPRDDFFDPLVIRDLYVDIPAASWAAIDAQAEPPFICAPWHRDYYDATVTYDGQVFEHAGVKVRGNGTAEPLERKASLKINLEWDDPAVPGCPGTRRIYGMKHLTLVNMLQDPSFVRVPLAHEIFAENGVYAQRTGYVRLHVNGMDYGIYANVETVDRQYLKVNFESNDGMLFEAGCHCDITSANVPPAGMNESDAYCFEREFTPDACDGARTDREPLEFTSLREFTAAVDALPPGEFYPAIEELMDFDQFLSMWATTAFLGSGDGYLQNQNSYRLYHDPSTHKFVMLQHGASDGVLRRDQENCDRGILGGGVPFSIWLTEGRRGATVLTSRCLAERDCQDAYAARVRSVLARWNPERIATRARALHDLVWPELRRDSRYFYSCDGVYRYSEADFERHFDEYVMDWIRGRAAEVRAELAARGY